MESLKLARQPLAPEGNIYTRVENPIVEAFSGSICGFSSTEPKVFTSLSKIQVLMYIGVVALSEKTGNHRPFPQLVNAMLALFILAAE